MCSRPIGLDQLLAAAIGGNSPRHIGACLVAAFQAVAPIPDRVGQVHATLSTAIGASSDPIDVAMRSAGNAIAASMDRDAARHDRHAYHNRQHACEVMLSAHVLGRRHALPERDSRRLLLAALIHDLDHDGSSSRGFEVERRSLARAAPFLADAGVDPDTCGAIATMVLATEPLQGVAVAVAAHRAHLHDEPFPPIGEAAPELRLLTLDPALARSAFMLCEADVLPSVGLSAGHAMRLQDRLSQEWRRPLGAADKVQFLDEVMNAGLVDAFFVPNLMALRESLVGCVDAAER